MTLRARLLSLMLSMIALVALTLIALNLYSLATNSVDVAIGNSELAARQIQTFIMHRLSGGNAANTLTLAETKQLWTRSVADDSDLAALLRGTMAQSRSIIEINVAGEDSTILATSDPHRLRKPMVSRQDLRDLHAATPIALIAAVLKANDDYETTVPLGISTQKSPVFTIQVLIAPTMLRDSIKPALYQVAGASGPALILAFFVAYWSAQIALRPLAKISHLIDDIAGGEVPAIGSGENEEARELAIIESKLSLLGERFRDAKEDASQLRVNLEGALEKLDAGARVQIEGQLAMARRLTAINSLTGRVAHEIKNPLNSIALRLELLRSRVCEEAPDTGGEFSILSDEVNRLDRVVRTFLDFNRPVDLELEKVDAVETAREVLQFLEPEAAEKGIATRFDAPEEPALIQADPVLLRQALINVAVNAIEAMERGGKLSIAVRNTGCTCDISIEDTGPGIPKDRLDKIFQLYFTTKPRGSGIGLAMAYRAVQLHGGTIDVRSEAGNGTVFLITLPLTGWDGSR